MKAINLVLNKESPEFSSEEVVWEWVKNNALCRSCLEALDSLPEKLRHPANTSCGCEWDVE